MPDRISPPDDRRIPMMKAWFSPFRLGLILGCCGIVLTGFNLRSLGFGLFSYRYIPNDELLGAAGEFSDFSFLFIYVSGLLLFRMSQVVMFWPFVETFLFVLAASILRFVGVKKSWRLVLFVTVMFAVAVFLHNGSYLRKYGAGIYYAIYALVYSAAFDREGAMSAFRNCFKVHAWSNFWVNLVAAVIPQYMAAIEAMR